jgi:hypothetical protein
MDAERHLASAHRIERSLAKCGQADWEMKIEAAMLAGTHWLNATLHRVGATQDDADVFHTYLLTVNEFRRLSVADAAMMQALADIEDLRPPFVRGNWPGGQRAAERALDLLKTIRARAQTNGGNE